MTVDEVIAKIIRLLFEQGASDWEIQDKAVLLAAIKLQLQEKQKEPNA
ncbi:MAG: hypothetical protein GY832_32235 [Chloroflexi bacterium]|nr:hypothetical protein [Chloroflexota bacterium]